MIIIFGKITLITLDLHLMLLGLNLGNFEFVTATISSFGHLNEILNLKLLCFSRL